MATVISPRVREYGPESNGIVMTPREFDRAEFVEGWRYELINGVLVVTPYPLINERDPNEELGHWLRNYQEAHPQGSALDATVNEQTIESRANRRRGDRVIWAGLGRLPRKNEKPTIIVEFDSAGRRDRKRDYETKRDEYLKLGVREYWVFDRFQCTLTVFTASKGKVKKQVFRETQTYETELLPGFKLPVARLLGFANRWPEAESSED